MSLTADCPGCYSGHHDRHRQDWNIRPGVLGGSSCHCKGDCDRRARERYSKFERLYPAKET
jgi:hypothetical protein